jgi:hypothetical protein
MPLKSSDFHAAVEAGARAEISLEVMPPPSPPPKPFEIALEVPSNLLCPCVGIPAKHLCFQVPFEDAPLREALRKVASRHTGGKVVINMELRGGADVASVSNQ